MEHVKTVDVISLCSTDGEILPLRLRSKDENGEWIRGIIKEILCTKENKQLGYECCSYLCRVQMDGRIVVLELKYDVRMHSWQLLRRLY